MIKNNDANITINHVNDNLENMELDRVKKGSTEVVDVMVMGGGEVEISLYEVLLKTRGGLINFLLLGEGLPERGNDIHNTDIKGEVTCLHY